ncbi:hypothetical protein JCM31826_10280 [Thermaurantimonas aggregans]|uniref:Uncharacterized protein n=1 Tax=Thermaurantimonas aggregans TaxID=2173829 RepID=A0A401XKI9_9FLAO|nr:hypothetical protein [Thermaurantimonas aggregans]MCX8147883.1 hypothetical protein [Thermaurantimonas aggregans]GCD77546.1 hypothetical protein JCM31826_10280 [Thermaurantimonas aggregans]
MRIFFAAVLSVIAYHAVNAQSANLPKFETGSRKKCFVYNPSAGDSLIYEVQTDAGETYLFKIFLKQYDPFDENSDQYCTVMDWISTSSKGGKGSIYVSCNALSDADKYVNFFFPGITMLKSNMSAIFLSRKSYHERSEQTIYIDQKPVTLFELFGNPAMDVTVRNKKKKYTLEAYKLVDNESFNYIDPSYASHHEIWVQANSRSPLIVYMKLPQFTLTLKEIK